MLIGLLRPTGLTPECPLLLEYSNVRYIILWENLTGLDCLEDSVRELSRFSLMLRVLLLISASDCFESITATFLRAERFRLPDREVPEGLSSSNSNDRLLRTPIENFLLCILSRDRYIDPCHVTKRV